MADTIIPNLVSPRTNDAMMPEAIASSSEALRLDNNIAQGSEQDVPDHAREREDVLPNGGYGWVCVVCLHLINGHTWGINFVSDGLYLFALNHLIFPTSFVILRRDGFMIRQMFWQLYIYARSLRSVETRLNADRLMAFSWLTIFRTILSQTLHLWTTPSWAASLAHKLC